MGIAHRLAARRRVLLRYERALWAEGVELVAGVDEVGVGPLAGPLVAAAVILPREFELRGVDDSKKLARRRAAAWRRRSAPARSAVGIGVVEVEEVDRLNTYWAALEAMRRAVAPLPWRRSGCWSTRAPFPTRTMPQTALIKGDARSYSIAAASIVAKVARDAIMDELDRRYPGLRLRPRTWATGRATPRRAGPPSARVRSTAARSCRSPGPPAGPVTRRRERAVRDLAIDARLITRSPPIRSPRRQRICYPRRGAAPNPVGFALMAIDVRMPKLSDNMEEGVIIRWMKAPGDSVEKGEPLAEVETDKADVELEAAASGVLREISVAEGESAAVGAVIAVLGGAAKRRAAGQHQPQPDAGPRADGTRRAPAEEVPAAAPDAAPPPRCAPARPRGRAHAPRWPDGARGGRTQPVRASPLAWRLAEDAGVDLSGGARQRARWPHPQARRRSGGARSDASAPAVSTPKATAPSRRDDASASGAPHRRRERWARRSRVAGLAHAADDRAAHGRGQARHPALLRHRRDRHERGDAAARVDQAPRGDARADRHPPAAAGAGRRADAPPARQRVAGATAASSCTTTSTSASPSPSTTAWWCRCCTAQTLSLREIAARAGALTERAREGSFSGDDLTGGTFSCPTSACSTSRSSPR